MDARCLLLGFVARLEGHTPMSERERFVVAESSGYAIHDTPGDGNTNAPLVIEVMVLDRGYCHRVVWSSLTSVMEQRYDTYTTSHKGAPKRWRVKTREGTAFRWPIDKRRRYAADLAARLNSEDLQAARETERS